MKLFVTFILLVSTNALGGLKEDCISYLNTQPPVKADLIASWGGEVNSYAATIDTRMREWIRTNCTDDSFFDPSFLSGLRESCSSHCKSTITGTNVEKYSRGCLKGCGTYYAKISPFFIQMQIQKRVIDSLGKCPGENIGTHTGSRAAP